LIDFSVAQELSTGVTGSVVGKPNYISPEQFRGKPTQQSDIYSLGATLYYLLMAKDPPPITVLKPDQENEAISSKLGLLVTNCTELDVLKRYQSAADVLRDLA
jgi:serine/threonine protein kinase